MKEFDINIMDQDNKTIAFFSGFYLPFLGGIERYTDKITTELVKMGYNVVIVTTNHDNLKEIEEDSGRTILRLPSKKLFKQRYPLLEKNEIFRKLMSKLEGYSIDYVICNTRFQLTTLLGLKFAKEKKLPSLVLDHGSSHFTVNNKSLDFFGEIYEHLLTERIKSFRPDFYAVSKRSSNWLKHFKINSKGVIYNSVPDGLVQQFADKEFCPKESNAIFVTYAGRIIKEKGIEMLLKSFVANQYTPNIKLMIAGDGPEFDSLKNQYSSEQIHFLGKLNFDDTMSLLSQTDIFVYPSMYPEGLPTSILEAGFLSCAVIATDRGGTVEVITDDSLGIIIEENENSLMSALDELVNNSDKRKQLQSNLQQRIKQCFTWSKTVQYLDQIIQRDLEDR